MKRILLSMTALAAISGGFALTATAAQAQSWDPRAGYSSQRDWDDRCNCRHDSAERYERYERYDRCEEHRSCGDHAHDHRDSRESYGPPSGPGGYMGYYDQYQPGRSAWRPGLLLPPYFRGYLVSDPRLARAKRGAAWYRIGNEYILADTASGEIRSIVTFP